MIFIRKKEFIVVERSQVDEPKESKNHSSTCDTSGLSNRFDLHDPTSVQKKSWFKGDKKKSKRLIKLWYLIISCPGIFGICNKKQAKYHNLMRERTALLGPQVVIFDSFSFFYAVEIRMKIELSQLDVFNEERKTVHQVVIFE